MYLFLRYSFILMILLQTQTCENQNATTPLTKDKLVENATFDSVTMQQYGGMLGHKEVMTINSKTITYSFQNVQNPKPKIQESATSPELWNGLTQMFHEDKFKTLKDGDSHVVYDGMDMIYTVHGDFGELRVTNPIDNNEELKPFFDLLNKTRHEFYMKSAE